MSSVENPKGIKIYIVKGLPLIFAFQTAQFSPIPRQLLIVAFYKFFYKSYQGFFVHIQANNMKIFVPSFTQKLAAMILPSIGTQ